MFQEVSIKKIKEYWNQHPCNALGSSSLVGTKQYFDEVESFKYFIEPHIIKFAEFEKWKGKEILEIGCGIGTDTINFARAGANVTAVDLSEKSLDSARQRASVYGLENKINFYCANAEEISNTVPVKSYDLIYSFGVIHHTSHPDKVVGEIQKYAKPGTIVKLMVYNRFSWPVFWIILFKGKGAFWKLDELMAKNSESQNCPVVFTYSLRGARKILKDFKIIDIRPECFISKSNLFLRLSAKSKLFKALMPAVDWLTKSFGWHILITAIKE